MTDTSLCPSHMLPLNRRRVWTPVVDAFMCAACESALLARRASRLSPIPDIPADATPAEALKIIFSREV
jgi:hypothetical protein